MTGTRCGSEDVDGVQNLQGSVITLGVDPRVSRMRRPSSPGTTRLFDLRFLTGGGCSCFGNEKFSHSKPVRSCLRGSIQNRSQRETEPFLNVLRIG